MTYAIIQIGDHQYKVAQGDQISLQKIDAAEGSVVSFSEVLCLSKDGQLSINPKGASVKATIVSQSRDRKIVVYKKKRRKGYEKTQGHRQYLTTVKIDTVG